MQKIFNLQPFNDNNNVNSRPAMSIYLYYLEKKLLLNFTIFNIQNIFVATPNKQKTK